ncbi:Putative addiction module component [Opitutaceae bacterium TAV1]|nr:Putative addiction module component [Opitutaceae bacterium TAV1]
MSMTVEQIVAEARQMPRQSVAELFDRIGLALHGDIDPGVEAAWNEEALRRLDEIESGKARAIPGEEVMARMRELIGR